MTPHAVVIINTVSVTSMGCDAQLLGMSRGICCGAADFSGPLARMLKRDVSQVAIAVGDDKLRPSVPRGVHPGLAGIARAALDPEPSMRPDFGSLVEQLGPLAAELQAGEAASLPRDGTGVFGRLFKPQ